MKFFSALVMLSVVAPSDASFSELNHVIAGIRLFFGLDEWTDIRDIVAKMDNETYVFNDVINEFLEEIAIPELCEMTTDKIALYNSYLLNKPCLEEMNSVGAQCRDFKCKLAHYIKENGPRIIYTLFDEDSTLGSFSEGAAFLGKELSAAFEELEMCTCGKKFLKAATRCAPQYFTNAFFDLNGNEPMYVVINSLFLKHTDTDALGKAIGRLMDHLCEKTSGGRCVNSITEVLGRYGDFYENSFVYDIHDFWEKAENGADEEVLTDIMKKCDTFWYVQTTVDHDWDHYEPPNSDFLYAANLSHAFFCDKYCQEKRGMFYPCCMKDLLRDKKMWDNIVKVGKSIYITVAVTYNDFGDISNYYIPPEELYPDVDEFMDWLDERAGTIRKLFLRWLDGAKTCKKEVECINF